MTVKDYVAELLAVALRGGDPSEGFDALPPGVAARLERHVRTIGGFAVADRQLEARRAVDEALDDVVDWMLAANVDPYGTVRTTTAAEVRAAFAVGGENGDLKRAINALERT